jgi:hypothetical protein
VQTGSEFDARDVAPHLAELGPTVRWLAIFFAAVVAVFVLYVGVALRAVLSATDEEQRKVRLEVFKDLLGLFRRRKQP